MAGRGRPMKWSSMFKFQRAGSLYEYISWLAAGTIYVFLYSDRAGVQVVLEDGLRRLQAQPRRYVPYSRNYKNGRDYREPSMRGRLSVENTGGICRISLETAVDAKIYMFDFKTEFTLDQGQESRLTVVVAPGEPLVEQMESPAIAFVRSWLLEAARSSSRPAISSP